jgi:glycosyltransferase involved in cell wall biosynthesis
MQVRGMDLEGYVSVVICTHNPRKDVLEKALQALSMQTLAPAHWDLLIIDNDSAEPVEGWVRAPWCKNMRVIRESERGINFARTRGLREARGDLVLFVDDDNVLEANYLATALRIGSEHPQLGIWGGIIELEFEVKPPSWIDLYRPLLAERLVERDVWSNLIFDGDSTPITAGCCLRRELAQAFVRRMENLPAEFRLGRRGSQLTNCEDIDLAWTVCQYGWGMGLFRGLRLKHLIPPGRLEEDYLLRLSEGTAYSFILLNALWGQQSRLTLLDRCVRRYQIQKVRQLPLRARMKSELRGQQRAHRWLKTPRIRQLLAAASCRSASSSNSSLDAAILAGRV